MVRSYLRLKVSYLPNHSARAGYDTRSIFKAEFNRFELKVFLLLTSCLTKAEEPNLPYYLPSWRENNWIHTFPKGISAMWNAISPGFELVSPCPIPATITITPRAPPSLRLKV